jgi:dienelactone hydrolase
MKEKILWLFLVFFIVMLISNGSYAADIAEIQKNLQEHYTIKKPEGTGPFPAVMLVPGCSGFHAEFQKGHYDNVQKHLVELGYVTLRVNYQAARNVDSCYPDVSANAVADDICTAAEYLHKQTFVKTGAINILAWSYGAAGALRALRASSSREPAKVDALVSYYPSCDYARKWDSKVPVLVLVGSIDNVAPLTKCEALFSYVPNKDKITIRVYDDAHHGFDNPDLPAQMQYQFGTLGYNEGAANAAWDEVTKFLYK